MEAGLAKGAGASYSARMSASRSDLRAFLLLGLVMLFWAGNSIVGRAVRDDIAPFTLAFLRWTLAFALMLPIALPALRTDWRALVRAWPIVLLLGVAGVGAFNSFLYSGLRHTTASNALLLQAAIPAVVLLFDRLIFRARAGIGQIAGVAVSTIGVIAIVFRGDPRAALALQFGHGDALILCGVVAWAIYTVFLRLRPAVAPAGFIAVTFAIGAVVVAPFAASEALAGDLPRWSPGLFGAIAYVVLLPSIAAYFLFNAAVARIGPGKAGQAITLMPLFGAILSVPLLGEVLHGYHAAGMALILGGIVISFVGTRSTPS
jgi:drug/metabolite transporter (DMT)-like permease